MAHTLYNEQFVGEHELALGLGGLTTQGDSLAELHAFVADAANGFFEPSERPARVRLHFVQDPVVSLA